MASNPEGTATGFNRMMSQRLGFGCATASSLPSSGTIDQMDCHFHLFTEDHTSEDAVVYRGGPTGYRLGRLDSGRGGLGCRMYR